MTGVVYTSHFDVWLINKLQVLLEKAHHLVPDASQLVGWVNSDLYLSANEHIGILPIPAEMWALSDMQSFNPHVDSKLRHMFLARAQDTKCAVISVHTLEEKWKFKELMQGPLGIGTSPDFQLAAKLWNQEANGMTVFYKVV